VQLEGQDFELLADDSQAAGDTGTRYIAGQAAGPNTMAPASAPSERRQAPSSCTLQTERLTVRTANAAAARACVDALFENR
jgi:hypothetical protein